MSTTKYGTPVYWFEQFAKYIIRPRDFDFGDFVIISDSTPKDIKEFYKKYIGLACKYLQTRDDIIIIENRRIVGINPNAAGKERAQGEIVLELISLGYINNNPFLRV